MTGTSPRATVSDTRVWQLAVLPSAEAYCGATPPECVPFLAIAVSSITSTASLPPTSPVRLNTHFPLHRRRIPHPGCNEVVQLIVFAARNPIRHRPNALAITGTDQTRHVQRTYPSARFVTKRSRNGASQPPNR